MSEPSTIGELIRERRLARGLSLGQLAASVGRTAATVRSWERGQHQPAPDVLDRLAIALGVSADDLGALMYSEDGPSLTVISGESDDDAAVSESTTTSGDALVETDDAADHGDMPEAGEVESAPAEPASEAEFTAASADELGVMPRIQVPVDEQTVEEPGDVPVEAEPPEPALPDDRFPEPEVSAPIEPEPVSFPDPAAAGAVMASPGLDIEDRDLLDEPTEAIGPPVAAPAPVQAGAPTSVAIRAETLQEPELPPFLAPLRALFDPDKKWLYWLRGALTLVVLLVLLFVLAWAVGELLDGIGAVLDTIESTESVDSGLVPLN